MGKTGKSSVAALLAAALVGPLLLVGCGQKGPLMLPTVPQPAAAASAPVPAPAR